MCLVGHLITQGFKVGMYNKIKIVWCRYHIISDAAKSKGALGDSEFVSVARI